MSRAARYVLPYRSNHLNSCPQSGIAPKCQGAAARKWLASSAIAEAVCPCSYYHVCVTLPAPISDIAYQNKAAIYEFAIQGVGRDTDHDARPKAPRRSGRPLLPSAHVGLALTLTRT